MTATSVVRSESRPQPQAIDPPADHMAHEPPTRWQRLKAWLLDQTGSPVVVFQREFRRAGFSLIHRSAVEDGKAQSVTLIRCPCGIEHRIRDDSGR